MAINFPNNPAVNDTFTVSGTTFTFTGVKWETSAVVEISSDTTPTLGGNLDGGAKNINNVGVITATAFHGDGSALTGLTGANPATYGGASVSPQITVDANGRITAISNVSISGGGGGGGTSIILRDSQSLVGAAGTIDFGTGLSVSAISAGVGTVTGITTAIINADTLNVTGISTLGNVLVGGGTTDLVVSGDARVTGILTVGSSSLTLDGSNNIVQVGTALTLGHTQGLQFHTQNLHSAGFEVNNINSTGIVTAVSYSGITTSMISDYGGGISSGDSFPTGGIILWSGAANAIPTGWVLCDGQNSTPDLRNRFVVGAGDSYAVDATGGSADAIVVSHTHASGNLSTGNAGSHSHSGNTNNTGDHSHSGNTNNTGSHQHRWGTDDTDEAGGTGNPDANGGQSWRAWTDSQGSHSHNINTNNSGSHSHNINTNNTGDHSHNVSGNVGSSGNSGTGANLPPYYALCYIMKS